MSITVTDENVETLKDLLEQIVPSKARMNVDSLNKMDRANETPLAKFQMLLQSLFDTIEYGN